MREVADSDAASERGLSLSVALRATKENVWEEEDEHFINGRSIDVHDVGIVNRSQGVLTAVADLLVSRLVAGKAPGPYVERVSYRYRMVAGRSASAVLSPSRLFAI